MADNVRRVASPLLEGLDAATLEAVVGELEIAMEERQIEVDSVAHLLTEAGWSQSLDEVGDWLLLTWHQ
jgi:hypothetical protein